MRRLKIVGMGLLAVAIWVVADYKELKADPPTSNTVEIQEDYCGFLFHMEPILSESTIELRVRVWVEATAPGMKHRCKVYDWNTASWEYMYWQNGNQTGTEGTTLYADRGYVDWWYVIPMSSYWGAYIYNVGGPCAYATASIGSEEFPLSTSSAWIYAAAQGGGSE